jgi:hypothetical protein
VVWVLGGPRAFGSGPDDGRPAVPPPPAPPPPPPAAAGPDEGRTAADENGRPG